MEKLKRALVDLLVAAVAGAAVWALVHYTDRPTGVQPVVEVPIDQLTPYPGTP